MFKNSNHFYKTYNFMVIKEFQLQLYFLSNTIDIKFSFLVLILKLS